MATNLDSAAPGIPGIIFGVGTSVILGALLAVVHLISRPVEVVQSLPKEPAVGVRYVLQGTPGKSAGSRWKIKMQRLLEKTPADYSISSAEMNAWSAETFAVAELPKGETPSFALLTGVPNFYVGNDLLHVSVSNSLLLMGSTHDLVVEAKGTFVKRSGGWAYVPSEFYFGGLPAHRMPVLASLLLNRFTKAQAVPEGAAGVLDSASTMTISKGMLAIRMP